MGKTKKISVFLLSVLLLMIFVFRVSALSGIGITPSCYNYENGKCVPFDLLKETTFEFHIYNYDNETKYFIMDSDDYRVRVYPKNFTLSQDNRLGCDSSPGCQVVLVTINPRDFDDGNYTIHIKATTSSGGGVVNLNQVIGSRISFNVDQHLRRRIIGISFSLTIILIIASALIFAWLLLMIWKDSKREYVRSSKRKKIEKKVKNRK